MHQFLILCSLKLTWRKVLSVVVKKSDAYVKNTFALTPSSCSLAKIPASCRRKKVKFQKKVHFMSFSCEIHFFSKGRKMPDNLSYSFSSLTLKSQITTGYTKNSNRKTKCKDERRWQAYSKKKKSECSKQESKLWPSDLYFGCCTTER